MFTKTSAPYHLILFLVAAAVLACAPMASYADHGPKKMWQRQVKPYFTAHETGMMGPFAINVQTFGQKTSEHPAKPGSQDFDVFFKDRFNLAAVVRKKDEIVYSRFNAKRAIDGLTPLHGMSMSKTALGASVGALLCDGSIGSLDEPMGLYADSLKDTPYSNVTIRNVLQMNSGVTPRDGKNNRLANRMAMGLREYAGKANVLDAVRLFKQRLRQQGESHNYHSADSFALSLLVHDVTGKSAGQIFYENIFRDMNPIGQMHWATDNEGRTVSQARLVMNAHDWNAFGQFILDEMARESCLGRFFKDGLETPIPTRRPNVGYGYHFWVYEVNGENVITMTGHGGFFNVLSRQENSVMSIFSVDPNYKAGNLFSKNVLAEIAAKVLPAPDGN